MSRCLLLLSQNNAGEPSLPVMVAIAFLLLLLPYYIYRTTGKSVTEWMNLSLLWDRLSRKLPFGKKAAAEETKKQTQQADRSAASLTLTGNEKNTFQGGTETGKGKDKGKSRNQKAKLQNGFMSFLSDSLNYARRKKLFVIIPGNVLHEGKTAELTLLMVTKARVAGVLCYNIPGKVICRRDGGQWIQELDGGRREIGCLVKEAEEQDRLVRAAMALHGLDGIPYETVMVFTAPDVVFSGDKPQNIYTGQQFFESLETERDLQTGSIDPKKTGALINQMRKKH